MLKETTFHSLVKISCGDNVSEVDARPSDAIALAMVTGSPIFVAEDIITRVGIDIPEESGVSALGSGMKNILEEIDGMKSEMKSMVQRRFTQEEVEKAREELIAAVFGS